jgi:hypothetical protein
VSIAFRPHKPEIHKSDVILCFYTLWAYSSQLQIWRKWQLSGTKLPLRYGEIISAPSHKTSVACVVVELADKTIAYDAIKPT